MSELLTREILAQNLPQVEAILAQGGEDVNEIDRYGYTPLIESAITNNPEMAAKLLEHGAKVNKRDLVGSSALHWAAENSNTALCHLLLDKGADPNAYNDFGEPVLVKPLLRRQIKLKELLYKFGADLKFAQDYINTKLLGHRFHLQGRVYMYAPAPRYIEINLEGFVLEFTVSIILESLTRFITHFAARHQRDYFPFLKQIITAFTVAEELLRYQQYMVDIKQYAHHIHTLLRQPLLLLPMGYEGHAITFIKYGNLFAKIDRGENSQRHPASMIYRITVPNAVDEEFLKYMLYHRQNSQFVNHAIFELLGLEPVLELPLTSQITGNCSWANVEGSVPTMLAMLLLKDPVTRRSSKEIQEITMNIFHQWCEWDKSQALHQCIENFYQAAKPRQAAIAALLAAVLFQTCHYHNEKDIYRAKKIIPIFDKKRFRFILDAYIQVYSKNNQTQAGRNLLELLDLYDHGHY